MWVCNYILYNIFTYVGYTTFLKIGLFCRALYRPHKKDLTNVAYVV